MRTAHAAALLLLVLAAGSLAPPVRAADPAPTVDSITPDHGLVDGGYTAVITGTNFTAPLEVSFGGILSPSVVIDSPTQITVEVPPHARGSVDVVVTQTTPPPSPSAVPGTFTYEAVPCRAWVPRAPGVATEGNPGGFDVAVVDVANRRVDASLDLNPADALLPTDDDWRVTQVLFSADGTWAFLATAGIPGTSDSRRIFVVKTARLLGAEEGDPLVASLDTGGNPYQLALSSDGKTLFAADGGSWKTSTTQLPDGTFRVFNVTDPAAPLAVGSPTAVGVLPVLTWDSTSYRKWGTNSSFTGQLQVRNARTTVTNIGSHTMTTIDVPTRAVTGTTTATVDGGGPIQVSASLPSPYNTDFLLVETTDLLSQATSYFVQRLEFGDLIPRGPLSQPVSFIPLPAPSVPPKIPDFQNRTAWPHPDGASLVALPATGAKVVTWKPASGTVGGSATVPGDGAPTTLAMNDVSDLYYARRNTGGWTVLAATAAAASAPVVVKQVEDATGIDSLRVVGDGTLMAGTAASTLAIIDANPSSPTAHEVLATVPLPLDPAGGALFPQPDPLCPPARTFVVAAVPGPGLRILLPLAATLYCASEAPPEIEFEAGDSGAALELELGSEPDFLKVPGSVRFRIRIDPATDAVVPPAGVWRRVLRASAGAYANPFWVRVNEVFPDGSRVYGQTLALGVCPPEPAEPLLPGDGAAADPGTPPVFSFEPGEEARRHWIEFGVPDFDGKVAGRFRVKDPSGASPPRSLWRRVARGGSLEWRVRSRDRLGRIVHSEIRSLDTGD